MVSYWSPLSECIESSCVTGVDSATRVFVFAHASILSISHDSLAASTNGLLAYPLESLVAKRSCACGGWQFRQFRVLYEDFPLLCFALAGTSLVHGDV